MILESLGREEMGFRGRTSGFVICNFGNLFVTVGEEISNVIRPLLKECGPLDIKRLILYTLRFDLENDS